MTMLAAFAGLLRYLSGASDLLVGADIANRQRREFETLIGFFINLVALRIKLDGDQSFSELLARVREVTLGAYDHQDFPFEKLVETLRPERSALHAALFQVKLVFHNVPLTELDLQDLTFETIPFEPPRTELDLVLHVYEDRQRLRAVFEYRRGLFEVASISKFAELLQLLLQSVLAKPSIRLSTLMNVLAEQDRAIRDAARTERLAQPDGSASCRQAPKCARQNNDPIKFAAFPYSAPLERTMTTQGNKPALGSVRRRSVTFGQAEPMIHGFLPGCGEHPIVVEAPAKGLRLSSWVTGRRAELEVLTARHGAVLLRGFAVDGVPDFEDCVEKLCGGALEYRFRASPRTEVGRHVYTATDYPSDQTIFPHNEHSYSPICPRYLSFIARFRLPKGARHRSATTVKSRGSSIPRSRSNLWSAVFSTCAITGLGSAYPGPLCFRPMIVPRLSAIAPVLALFGLGNPATVYAPVRLARQ